MLFLKVLRVIEFLNILLVASIMPSGDTNNSTDCSEMFLSTCSVNFSISSADENTTCLKLALTCAFNQRSKRLKSG